jgi:hypothetical protein
LKIEDIDGVKRELIIPPLITLEDIRIPERSSIKSLSIKAEEGEPLKIKDVDGIKREPIMPPLITLEDI